MIVEIDPEPISLEIKKYVVVRLRHGDHPDDLCPPAGSGMPRLPNIYADCLGCAGYRTEIGRFRAPLAPGKRKCCDQEATLPQKFTSIPGSRSAGKTMCRLQR
jgi:hypothetical protein